MNASYFWDADLQEEMEQASEQMNSQIQEWFSEKAYEVLYPPLPQQHLSPMSAIGSSSPRQSHSSTANGVHSYSSLTYSASCPSLSTLEGMQRTPLTHSHNNPRNTFDNIDREIFEQHISRLPSRQLQGNNIKFLGLHASASTSCLSSLAEVEPQRKLARVESWDNLNHKKRDMSAASTTVEPPSMLRNFTSEDYESMNRLIQPSMSSTHPLESVTINQNGSSSLLLDALLQDEPLVLDYIPFDEATLPTAGSYSAPTFVYSSSMEVGSTDSYKMSTNGSYVYATHFEELPLREMGPTADTSNFNPLGCSETSMPPYSHRFLPIDLPPEFNQLSPMASFNQEMTAGDCCAKDLPSVESRDTKEVHQHPSAPQEQKPKPMLESLPYSIRAQLRDALGPRDKQIQIQQEGKFWENPSNMIHISIDGDHEMLTDHAEETAGSLWLLLHAWSCNETTNCITPSCYDMKRVLRHCLQCNLSLTECKPACNKARWMLLHYRKCGRIYPTQKNKCLVCSRITRLLDMSKSADSRIESSLQRKSKKVSKTKESSITEGVSKFPLANSRKIEIKHEPSSSSSRMPTTISSSRQFSRPSTMGKARTFPGRPRNS